MSSSAIAAAADPAEEKAITDRLAMWAFLASEVMFFGGMFFAYGLYRAHYPAAFQRGGREMELGWGTANTAILLTSSFFMSVGERAARAGARRRLRLCLGWVIGLGLLFLCIKGYEYQSKVAENLIPGRHFRPDEPAPLQLFMTLYFAMTGLHAVHMLAGIGVMAWIWRRCSPSRPGPVPADLVSNLSLYWHFVDCIWIFLYPLFYLPGR